MLASCSGDKTVRIWQQNPSGKPSDPWECKAILDETHTRTVRSCAWSPSGKHLATASFDATTAIWEHVGDDFECVATLEGHDNEVKCVSWNSSGSLLATCRRDKSVWIWEVLPGNEFECVVVLQGHTQDVKMVQCHPDVDILFSCSYDNTIKVWGEDGDSDYWECLQTLDEANNGHSSTVWVLSFNSAGDKMVTSSYYYQQFPIDDLTLKVWGPDSANKELYTTMLQLLKNNIVSDDRHIRYIEWREHERTDQCHIFVLSSLKSKVKSNGMTMDKYSMVLKSLCLSRMCDIQEEEAKRFDQGLWLVWWSKFP
ncbi:hypothetical protein ACHQM5_007352 [Ranunculus cassubicifolius]